MPSIIHHDRAAPRRLPASDVTWVSSWVSRFSRPRCWTTSVRTTTSVTVSLTGTAHAAAQSGCSWPYHLVHSVWLARKITYRLGAGDHLANVSATAAALSAAVIALSSRHSFVFVAATIARVPRFTMSWSVSHGRGPFCSGSDLPSSIMTSWSLCSSHRLDSISCDATHFLSPKQYVTLMSPLQDRDPVSFRPPVRASVHTPRPIARRPVKRRLRSPTRVALAGSAIPVNVSWSPATSAWACVLIASSTERRAQSAQAEAGAFSAGGGSLGALSCQTGDAPKAPTRAAYAVSPPTPSTETASAINRARMATRLARDATGGGAGAG